MEIINFAKQKSLVSKFMMELRNVDIQRDTMRFRRNLERIGEVMAYEISKRLDYATTATTTPLGTVQCDDIASQVVLATILRAGVPFHQGFLNYFDDAQNAFVSAYRKYKPHSDVFDIHIEYIACPRITGKTVIIADPMLATGSSMELAYQALLTKGKPAHVHIAAVIASQQAIDFVQKHFPEDTTTVWVGAIDPSLNPHSYIVPGLGDAGDLAYGDKE